MMEFPIPPFGGRPAEQDVSAGSHEGADPPGDEPPAEERKIIEDPILEAQIVDVLRTVYDPEIPVDVYELGLIYDVDIREGGSVDIRMTLTSPACPAAGLLPPEVEAKVRAVPGVTDTTLELVWDPPWDPSMMSEAARLQLGF